MAIQTIGVNIQKVTKMMAEVTGLVPVEVTGVAPYSDGWRLHVELLELAKIPSSSDIIAEFEVLVGPDGTLISFQRLRSRLRGETVAGELV